MFSEKQISAYRSIRAPEKLRECVVRGGRENAKKNSGNWAIRLAPLCAALLLILGLAFFFPRGPQVSVLVDGNEVVGSLEWVPAPGGIARSVSAFSLPFEIQGEKETEVSVSQGFLISEDETIQTSLTFHGDASFLWEIREGVTEARMEITCGKTLRRFVLTFDDAQNKFLIKEI